MHKKQTEYAKSGTDVRQCGNGPIEVMHNKMSSHDVDQLMVYVFTEIPDNGQNVPTYPKALTYLTINDGISNISIKNA